MALGESPSAKPNRTETPDSGKLAGQRKKGREGVHKRNVYFPAELAEEIQREADRLDRSPSWLLLRAWVLARRALKQLPEDPLPKLLGPSEPKKNK